MSAGSGLLRAEVPGVGYHRRLISCQDACPVHTDARGYVRAIAEGRFEEAYLIARGPNPFASLCGRICGAPCEAACRRGKIPQVDDDGRYIKYSIDDGPGPVAKDAVVDYFGEVRVFPVTVPGDSDQTVVVWTSSWASENGGVHEFCDPIYRALLTDMKGHFG